MPKEAEAKGGEPQQLATGSEGVKIARFESISYEFL